MRMRDLPAAAGLALGLATPPAEAQGPEAVDLMTCAQGALPVSVDAGGADLRVGMVQAIAAIDGAPAGFVMTAKPGTAADAVEIVYALPAPTRFDRFAVPVAAETPSPSQTFFRRVEVSGSAVSAEGPFAPLASGELGPEGETELTLAAERPEVRWVRLRLSDGVKVERERTFFEFSEIVGTGTHAEAPLSEGFSGVWTGRGVKIELAQDGATVSGCYDASGRLSGTVEGRVLRALGADAAGIPSQFVLIAAGDGGLRGLRSANGAPFKPYDGEAAAGRRVCPAPEPPRLGCGSVVHGIGFDYDSDAIRPGSCGLLAALGEGLAEADAARIRIVGHSSSEGAADYNRDLSRRRAAAVAAALAEPGLDPARLSAEGRGEDEPIASNADEAGRSLNRRVEILCEG